METGKTFLQFVILRQLGKGGMGDVYLAEDQKLGRKVALKFLPKEFVQNAERLRRFELEARSASALNHPNIVTIFDVGQEDGHHFIASEFIEGQTLRERITAAGTLSIAQAVDIAGQVAAALSAAHTAKIVHRDVKPENIMIREDGYVKVLDFGLAKHNVTEMAEGSIHPTKTFAQTEPGTVLGTVNYMSPEQARGLDLDSRTDLFSLGIVLYEMVTGRIPFEGTTRSDVIVSILNKEPVQLSVRVPDVPQQLEWIVNKALRKDREERYQTARELLGDLRALRQKSEDAIGSAISTSYAQQSSTAPPAGPTATTSSAEYVVQGIRKNKLAVAFILLILLIGYFLVLKYLRPEKTAIPAVTKTVSISRLTTSGNAGVAAISHDGKLVVYSAVSAGKESVWLKQIATGSNISIAPPANVQYLGFSFSKDGNYIYLVRKFADASNPALYRSPVLGGTPVKILDHINSAVSISPDGESFAFLRVVSARKAELMTARIDGSSVRTQIVGTLPKYVDDETILWSADGKRLFFVGATGDQLPTIYETKLNSGAEKQLTMEDWGDFRGGAIAAGSDDLLISAAHISTNYFYQIWSIPRGGGEPRRITNDPNNYIGLSASGDSDLLVTIQNDRLSDIWVMKAEESDTLKQITHERYDGRSGVSWTPDGKILFADRHFALWYMDPDGGNRTLLTPDEHSNRLPFATPDGKFIVFESWRKSVQGQRCNLWIMNHDATNLRLLAATTCNVIATCPRDCSSIYFDNYFSGDGIWKVPVNGGDAIQVIKEPSFRPTISPDGAWLAVYDDAKKQIAIYPVDGGSPQKSFSPASGIDPRVLRWTPDGASVAYINTIAGVSNLWVQPVNGSEAKQITEFERDQIFSFDWHPDGTIAVARGTDQNDVMLISLPE